MPFPPSGSPNGMQFNPMQMMSMMQSGFPMPWMMDPSLAGPSSSYDPHAAHMDMSIPPSGPRGNRRGSRSSAPTDAIEVTEGNGNMRDPSQRHADAGNANIQLTGGAPPGTYMSDGQMTPQFHPGMVPEIALQMDQQFAPQSLHGPAPGGRGGNRGRGRGGPSGTFLGSHDSSFSGGDKGPQKDNKTIVVEKIPGDHLSLSAVNDWFKRFGTVTNVAVDAPTFKALVSFSTNEEAHKAWKSQEAVFGNRFVKVFWHRPLAGHGEAGKKALTASAPVVRNMADHTGGLSASGSSTTVPSGPITSNPSALLRERAQKMDELLAEQKSLLATMSTIAPAEKATIMARLRSVMTELNKLSTSSASSSTTSSPAPSRRLSSTPAAPTSTDDSKIREKLDRELEEHGNVPGSASDSQVDKADGGRRVDLMAQLEELKKEVRP